MDELLMSVALHAAAGLNRARQSVLEELTPSIRSLDFAQ
jgi:hypothetical protein